MKAQLEKLYSLYQEEEDPLRKNIFLSDLQNRNETLFFRLLIDYIEEMGMSCLRMFIPWTDVCRLQPDMTSIWQVNGMGIPIGKLALYTAAGGIDPRKVLPVMLDLGTNNETYLKDPYYLGMQHRRLEDVLHAYRLKQLCFNDDIQGTGATVLAGALSACLRVNIPLKHQRILVLGAGSAGLGAKLDDARKQFYVFDQFGLLGDTRRDMTSGQQFFARNDVPDKTSLLDVIKKVKPTMILGLSAARGAFTEVSSVVFPVDHCCMQGVCWDLLDRIFGRPCVGADEHGSIGSPFAPVQFNGHVYNVSQCNNMFIFPGVGLGAVVCGATRVTDRMLYVAAQALATCMSPEEIAAGQVFPSVKQIRKVATAVVQCAVDDGLASTPPILRKGANLEEYVASKMYLPIYRALVEYKGGGMLNDTGAKVAVALALSALVYYVGSKKSKTISLKPLRKASVAQGQESGFGPKDSVTVRVPATTANMGPGFDCIGMAVDIWNELTVERADAFSLTNEGEGSDVLPTDETNLVVVGLKAAFSAAGQDMPLLRIHCRNRIPFARGLGSSSAGIVAGIIAGLVIAGHELSVRGKEELLQLVHKQQPSPFISIDRADAVFNIGRSALLVNALRNGNFKELRHATQDKLHQPQRGAEQYPHLFPLVDAALEAGAHACFLSGAGPTVLAICSGKSGDIFTQVAAERDETKVADAMREAAAKVGVHGCVFITNPEHRGAHIVRVSPKISDHLVARYEGDITDL
ncbi:hypothetical protein DYB32_006589 [Aphanomyces invadans]|uniref:Homoserine kinase n=1 Tax=Aphanomyces invadans TaxID=157072 RepID=A0A3R6V8E8_9STRA|nr:hypothetical protein DYB32_006589 [Aphanomyces invadans]